MSNEENNLPSEPSDEQLASGPSPAGPSDEMDLPHANDSYTADDLEHLSDLEHVRKRPAMYIGDVASRGLHHLVSEVVDNSIDEALAGFASEISVIVNPDGSVTVEDDGRGIPVEDHPDLGYSTLQGVMTVLKFGGKFSKGAYQTSGGLHGVGVTVVNFLSEECQVEVCRDGYVWQQEYERGVPTKPVTRGAKTTHHGTKTTFKPDPEIFPETKFDASILIRRLRDLAFLNHGVKITFLDQRTGRNEAFEYANGLIDFVIYLNRDRKIDHPHVIHMSGSIEGVHVEVAMQYTNEEGENLRSYVNNIHTIEGGTHISGFRSALTRTLNNYGKANDLFDKLIPIGDDFRDGLTAVISVKVPEPRFEGQTKTKLGNSEVEGIVNRIVGDRLSQYLEENPETAKVLIDKGCKAAKVREAVKKARQEAREGKTPTKNKAVDKLLKCYSKDPERCELYLVEGDSAGGSAEGGRLKEFQAVLPLRGKILNAYKSPEEKVFKNKEIEDMYTVLGFHEDYVNMKKGNGRFDVHVFDDGERVSRGLVDLTKLRYGKVVIMTDADIDGAHIRTLLLTFFYRQMYNLIQSGHVYVAKPPLYKVVRAKAKGKDRPRYVQTDEEMKRELLALGLSGVSLDPQDGRRIEGEQMKKLCQTLQKLEEYIKALEKRGYSLRDHVARQRSGRLPIYHVSWQEKEYWFTGREELDAFFSEVESQTGVSSEKIKSGGSISDALAGRPETDGEESGEQALRPHVTELSEVRSINRSLAELKTLGFEPDSLFPISRTGQEGARYYMYKGDVSVGLEDLRSLPQKVRESGEKGLIVTRYKGLGEMNPEELGETTLNPVNRTLVKVSLEDAARADEIFRLLMGDRVKPRREYIEEHALSAKNLDI